MTTLLQILMNMPPGLLIEGTEIEIVTSDGAQHVVTLGAKVAPDGDNDLVPPRKGRYNT